MAPARAAAPAEGSLNEAATLRLPRCSVVAAILLSDPAVEFLPGYHLEREAHECVADPAEFRALALVGARLAGGYHEPVVAPGDDVELVKKVPDVERVDHVIGTQPELDRLVDGDDEGRFLGRCADDRECALAAGGGVRAEVVQRIREFPLELEAVDLNRQVLFGGFVFDINERNDRRDEQRQHTDDRDRGPDYLEQVVAVCLRG